MSLLQATLSIALFTVMGSQQVFAGAIEGVACTLTNGIVSVPASGAVLPKQHLASPASPKAEVQMNVNLFYWDTQLSDGKKIATLTVPVEIGNHMYGADCRGTFGGVPLCVEVSGGVSPETAEDGSIWSSYTTLIEASLDVKSCENDNDVITVADSRVMSPVEKAPMHFTSLDTGDKRFVGLMSNNKDRRTHFSASVTYKIIH